MEGQKEKALGQIVGKERGHGRVSGQKREKWAKSKANSKYQK